MQSPLGSDEKKMTTFIRKLASNLLDDVGPRRAQTREFETVDIDAWYIRYGESIHHRLLMLCGDESNALDLTQETFLRAFRFRKTFRGDSLPSTWLFAIANRCFLDSLRKQQRRQRLDTQALGVYLQGGVDDAATLHANHQLLRKILSRADADVREIVIYRFFDEMTVDEIAAEMGIGEKTVRRKLQRFMDSARKFAGQS